MQILIVILVTALFSGILALLLGFLLGYFKDLFAVEKDPLIEKIRVALPSANCGACGYPGCDGYAEAIVLKGEKVDLCTTGGKATLLALESLTGKDGDMEDRVAVIRCQGAHGVARDRGEYTGVSTCRAARVSSGGTKTCPWGCAGFGDCVAVCKFDALSMGSDGLPRVNYDNCTGCGMCAAECPQALIELVPKDRKGAIALCRNQAAVKQTVAKACVAGCIKCELCVKACPRGAIRMEGPLPVVSYTACDSCGICVEKCPTGVFRLLEDIRGMKTLEVRGKGKVLKD